MDIIDEAQSIEQALRDAPIKRVRLAAAQMACRPSSAYCRECSEPIPDKRRAMLPGVQFCVECQAGFEQDDRYN